MEEGKEGREGSGRKGNGEEGDWREKTGMREGGGGRDGREGGERKEGRREVERDGGGDDHKGGVRKWDKMVISMLVESQYDPTCISYIGNAALTCSKERNVSLKSKQRS